MRLLLDTHVYLWWLADDPRLPAEAMAAISDRSAVVHVSAASVWEISIKAALGRLDLGGLDPVDEIAANGFSDLVVSSLHGWHAGRLPPHHRDPFDRMLVAQARCEQLALVTADDAIARYDVSILGQ